MIGRRSTSPHPSLSSSGSEEVRCSLDELDAVIATFDEEARKHCQSLSQLRSNTPTLADGHVHRRGSLSLEGTFPSGNADTLDYASATLRNPRINRLDFAPVQATEDFPTREDASPSFVEDEFPPPPPDAFAPENFILPPPSPPPPPPPLSPSQSPVLIRKQQDVPSTQSELITSITSSERNSQSLLPASPGRGDSVSVASITKRPNGPRPISSGACRRPMVPQRAPSTRLSSVPITCNGTEEFRPRSVAVDSTIPVKESAGSVASLPNSHLKSPSSNCVPSVLEKPAVPVEEPTIDQTVPPVSDIIRRFDRRGQLIVSASCRPGFVPPKPISNGTRENSRVNIVPTSSNESNTTHSDRKFSMPINSFGLITPTQPQTPTGHEPDLISPPKMQQMTRGFTLSRSNSVETNRRAPSSLRLCTSPLVRTISPPVLSPTTVNVISPARVPFFPDPNQLPPGASHLPSAKHLAPESHVSNGNSSSPSPLSSFGSVRKISSIGSARHSPPLPSPPPPQHATPSTTFSANRSNSVNHRVIDLSDSVSSQSAFPSLPPPPSTCTPPPPPSPPSTPSSIPPMAISPIGLATRVSGQVMDQAKTQLNPYVVVHQQLANTLQQRRASTETRPTAENPRVVSVHSMRLDPTTLETLVQFNIAEAHQIPGYQPVPPGQPDWKTQKLERKNRDAADAYAADLRKWGCIPQWKRELIEKRHHGKTDSTPSRTSSVTNDSHSDLTQSLISVELTEKLQRRLEKVAAMAES